MVFYLDTGAMYRCVTLYCLENNIDLDNLQQVEMALQKIDIDITRDKVFLNDKDVTDDIRTRYALILKFQKQPEFQK